MNNLLVIVDMVNGFVNFGNLADKNINNITPKIEEFIKQAYIKKDEIIAFKDCHSPDDEEFLTFPTHCLKGSPESELIPELKKYKAIMKIINKPTTNGFNTAEFKDYIKSKNFNNVVVCGCCTDICVQNFCESLKNYFTINKIATKIIVFEDGVATFNSDAHNAKIAQANALNQMQKEGINVVLSQKKGCENERTFEY